MESDSLLCHRQRGVTCLCDLRPCLAGHETNGMLLHQSPYLPTVIGHRVKIASAIACVAHA